MSRIRRSPPPSEDGDVGPISGGRMSEEERLPSLESVIRGSLSKLRRSPPPSEDRDFGPISVGGMSAEERLCHLESMIKGFLAKRGFPTDVLRLLEEHPANSEPALPGEIVLLAHALTQLEAAKWCLSVGRAEDAIHFTLIATKHAFRTVAQLLEKEQKSRKGKERGQKSGKVRRRKASRAWPVLDWYLERAADRSTDKSKTGQAKRAQRILSRHSELWQQAQDGDRVAGQRFSEEAAPGLDALLQDGWTPPPWQTLYGRLRSQKQ